MEQFSFIAALEPQVKEAAKPTPFELMAAGLKDISWPEEKARILNQGKKQ